jgi:2-polyprenyl-6-methoxyphenol hydroxylase-like FAD-dependent oxidoreductase
MADAAFDVIVVGARCAGSPTAMLLARNGYRVLMVDRATFPSDTLSTHCIQPPGVAALARWGLLDRVIATNCPPIDTLSFDFGPFTIAGSPGTPDSPVGYAPRRLVLDSLLVDAAAEAGVEVRENFTVEEILVDDSQVVGIRGHTKDGGTVSAHAQVVVGADGVHSLVAKTVQPEQYNEKPPLLCGYYAYWSDLPTEGHFENHIRPDRGWAAFPTNDGLTLVVAGWPYREFAANKVDVEGNYVKTFELSEAFSERLRSATRETRVVGTAVPGYFRKPFGDGWALVGDAGYNKDFITAQGITDAFRDAELCAAGLDEAFSGSRPFDTVMAEYQTRRDEHVLPMYEFTAQLASLEPAPPEMQQLLGAIHGNQEAMDAFARVNSGAMSPAEFFTHDNIEKIFAAAHRGGPAQT